jgi:2'-5' RNA ligase
MNNEDFDIKYLAGDGPQKPHRDWVEKNFSWDKDERSNTRQKELMFEADDETGEDDLSSFMRQMKLADPAQVRAFMDEHFEYSDYHEMWEIVGFSDFSGSAVDRANARYFQEKYPGVISVGHGGFNTEIFGVKESDFEKMDAAMLDALYKDLKQMQDYTVLDDELYGEIEEEKKNEAWKHWIKNDFKAELVKLFPQYEDHFDQLRDDPKFRQLFEMARDRGGAEWFEESGATQTIRLDDVLKGVNEQVLREWLFPEQEAAQGQFALESKRGLHLFHGTSSIHLDEAQTTGLRKPFLVDDPEIAMYYAQEEAERAGGRPMVLRVTVEDTSKLRADFPSFEEPLTFVYKKYALSEDEWHERLNNPQSGIHWPANQKDWQTSLKVVGSVRYDGTIQPGSISFDIPESLYESHKFSCLMADAPAQLAQKVIAWGKMFVTDDKIYIEHEHPDEYGREDTPHVTVKFGLHAAEPCEKLLQIIEETQPFEIGIAPCSLFDTSDKFDVVKFDIESDALHTLNERVSQLKNSDSHPEYHPHMTVAYVQKGTCHELIGKPLLPSDVAADFRFLVKAVVFSSPNGTKRTLFLGKPNLEEVPEPERLTVVNAWYQKS